VPLKVTESFTTLTLPRCTEIEKPSVEYRCLRNPVKRFAQASAGIPGISHVGGEPFRGRSVGQPGIGAPSAHHQAQPSAPRLPRLRTARSPRFNHTKKPRVKGRVRRELKGTGAYIGEDRLRRWGCLALCRMDVARHCLYACKAPPIVGREIARRNRGCDGLSSVESGQLDTNRTFRRRRPGVGKGYEAAGDGGVDADPNAGQCPNLRFSCMFFVLLTGFQLVIK
jgi:hypothetical protein